MNDPVKIVEEYLRIHMIPDPETANPAEWTPFVRALLAPRAPPLV